MQLPWNGFLRTSTPFSNLRAQCVKKSGPPHLPSSDRKRKKPHFPRSLRAARCPRRINHAIDFAGTAAICAVSSAGYPGTHATRRAARKSAFWTRSLDFEPGKFSVALRACGDAEISVKFFDRRRVPLPLGMGARFSSQLPKHFRAPRGFALKSRRVVKRDTAASGGR